MKDTKDIAVTFLQWVKKNATQRTTSRDNLYAAYWQMNATGVLYTDAELFDYWDANVPK